MDGILNLDKPAKITSQAAVTRVKRAFALKKAGHAGALDPGATGVLLVCLGKATKLFEALLTHDKEYEATLTLGVETDSYDADGKVSATYDPPRFELRDFEPTLAAFRGEIQQAPPMFSALKHKGKPLYKYAREGKTIEREPRTVNVVALEALGYDAPELRLRIVCMRGTYVRSLAHDIGRKLGCGAHISALRRTRSGSYLVNDAVALWEVEENPALAIRRVAPLEEARREAMS